MSDSGPSDGTSYEYSNNHNSQLSYNVDGSDRDEDADDNEVNQEKDGFADALSKILKQETGGESIPVLAKRKTTLMKDIENNAAETSLRKKLKTDKKEERDKQMVLPTLMTADYERQLRKLATRGVIALFNAISKAKHETEISNDIGEKTSGSKTNNVPSVKKMTQDSLGKAAISI